MTNAALTRIEQFRDVETLGHYADQIARGVPVADFLKGANANGRDNARTPMQWDAGPQAGFTTGTPWIEVNPNHATINVAADRADPDGIFAHYRRLIRLRRDLQVIVTGALHPMAEDHPSVMAYTRTDGATRVAVVANLTSGAVDFDVPDAMAGDGECLVSNHAARRSILGRIALKPFEAFAILYVRAPTPGPPVGHGG